MQQFVGLDVHKETITAAVMDSKGNTLTKTKFKNTTQDIFEFMDQIEPNSKIVMEACSVWQNIYELFEEEGFETILAHPLKTKAIASARIKTDAIDAETLANLLRANLIPEAYAPPKHIRELRDIVRQRASLVNLKIQIKNKIHSILHKNGIKNPFSDLFGKQGMHYLKNIDLGITDRYKLDQYMQILNVLDYHTNKVSKEIEKIAVDDFQAGLLISVPGISCYSALMILSEIGDIRRFENSEKLCSYAGLVPSVYQSGSKEYRGHITKQGSKWLRWILIQSANVAAKHDPLLSRFYAKIKAKKGHNIAVVATARKLLTYIYVMLKLGLTYDKLYANKRLKSFKVKS
jgi:transposase